MDSWDPDEFRTGIAETLESFVATQAGRLHELGPDAAVLTNAAAEAVRGGKRFRAAFCYWGHRAVSAPDSMEPLLRAAASLELLHASALVHDDLMDASDTRRGRPSAHRAFEARHRDLGWRGDPGQYGLASAILLGDLLLSWADELLRTSGFHQDRVLDALAYFDTTRGEVIAGQFLDVSVQARGAGDLEQAMRVVRYKSAKYSVERPLHIGAALAGASAPVIATLSRYGVPLGEAFQLRDDLLGVFGDPEVTGKPAGDDLVEGKRTVLVALALQGAEPADAELLDQSLGTPMDENRIARLREVIETSGAATEVERRIEALTTEALSALARADITDEARTVLVELAHAATQRRL
ncbi:MAG: polyprenyl synthetase family protein [Nocardioidaceae bacterium]|nr:MAG: polyprenyl synthetase family protein [Nocardioidaceae bacterium]